MVSKESFSVCKLHSPLPYSNEGIKRGVENNFGLSN